MALIKEVIHYVYYSILRFAMNGLSKNRYVLNLKAQLITLVSLTGIFSTVLFFPSCDDILKPEPIDQITNDEVLTDASSARTVVSGIYRNFANLTAPKIVAGDLSADLLDHNGTFTQYTEIGNNEMSASNGSAEALWGAIYGIAYRTNFLIEGMPQVEGILESQKNRLLAEARFLRGYAYFTGAYTYGGMPIATSTDLSENRNLERVSRDSVLEQALQDYQYALDKVPEEPENAGMVSNGAVKAALARYYLYQENWSMAEKYAGEVIDSVGTKAYQLESNFEDVLSDFSRESILEVVYSANDNPGTSTNFSINNLFEGRREIIPSDKIVFELRNNGGDRDEMIEFNSQDAGGQDNGWTITRYGPFDNVPVFRLSEMYLIRAEARAMQDNIAGTNSGLEDLNRIRKRAGLSGLNIDTRSQLLQAIEQERMVELAFEGHRWYDLKRTGRAEQVMEKVSPNWSETDMLWPVPLREIRNNPALEGEQNPGY